MRLLLDECVPKRLGRDLVDHEVSTVQQMGWSGITNGELLRTAAQEFDVFVTVDQNIEFQQNLFGADIAVVVLVAATNEIETLRKLVPQTLRAIANVNPGQLVRVAT